jgi:peptidoglycan/xylan/chitin deacetylase (PgdA/CDA1 family)
MKNIPYIIILLSLILSACNTQAITPVEQTAIADSIMDQISAQQTQVVVALTPTMTPTPLPATSTPTPTQTPQPSQTPTWVTHAKQEKVIAPILLYHHIRFTDKPGRYDVSPDMFKAQMNALVEWGYTSVTVKDLANVLRNGGSLPEKTVVISFDDGDLDVYQNAFPVMKDLGLVGTFYIVTNRLKSVDFVNAEQLKEMAAAGWEIGSHSHSHVDLSLNHGSIETESAYSKKVLEEAIGQPVYTYAYPYGGFDSTAGSGVASSGYIGAVGLGTTYIHSSHVVFYLSRIEIRNDYDMAMFSRVLPWSPVMTPMPLQ